MISRRAGVCAGRGSRPPLQIPYIEPREGGPANGFPGQSGIGTYTIPGLGPSQSVSYTSTCKAGTLTAVVDPANAVAESNEGNNTTTRVTSCLGFGT